LVILNCKEYTCSEFFYPNINRIIFKFDNDLLKYKSSSQKLSEIQKNDFGYFEKRDDIIFYSDTGKSDSFKKSNRQYSIEKDGNIKYITYDKNNKVIDANIYYFNNKNLIYKIEYKSPENKLKYYEEFKYDNQDRIIEYFTSEINSVDYIPSSSRKYEYESNKLNKISYKFNYKDVIKFTDTINYLNEYDYICNPCHETYFSTLNDERRHYEMHIGDNIIYIDIYYMDGKIHDLYIIRYFKNKLIKDISYTTTNSGQWYGYKECVYKTILDIDTKPYHLKESGVVLYKFPDKKDFSLTQPFKTKETLRKLDKSENLDIFKLIKENGKYKYAVVFTDFGELGICEINKLDLDDAFFKSIKFN
jgi:hypothetical protein